MPTLTLEIAQVLLDAAEEEIDSSAIVADEFEILDDAAARALAEYRGDLYLNGLTQLSDAAVNALAAHGNYLSLNGLMRLSDEAANALAKHRGYSLSLNGLMHLSDAAAKALANHLGYSFSLIEISCVALENRRRQFVSIVGFTSQLSDAAVAAEALAQSQGGISLNGLTQLSDAAAESLSKYDGALQLNGLTKISDLAAKALADHKNYLHLNGLTQLSDAAAETLAKHEGDLSLHGLRQFSEAAAEILSKHPSGVLRHREDGPAFTDAHGDRRWWFDGNQYDTAGEWAEAVLKSRNEPHDDDSVEDFLRHVLCKEDLI